MPLSLPIRLDYRLKPQPNKNHSVPAGVTDIIEANDPSLVLTTQQIVPTQDGASLSGVLGIRIRIVFLLEVLEVSPPHMNHIKKHMQPFF